MSAPPVRPAGERIQTWLQPELAAELRKRAAAERRSISSTVRIAVEDRLAAERRDHR